MKARLNTSLSGRSRGVAGGLLQRAPAGDRGQRYLVLGKEDPADWLRGVRTPRLPRRLSSACTTSAMTFGSLRRRDGARRDRRALGAFISLVAAYPVATLLAADARRHSNLGGGIRVGEKHDQMAAALRMLAFTVGAGSCDFTVTEQGIGLARTRSSGPPDRNWPRDTLAELSSCYRGIITISEVT
jgi:hypothetical protein